MTKLPIWTLKNIEKSEIKALFKENKAISGFKDYFRDYVENVLKEEWKNKFEKDDFEVMWRYIENIKEYQKELKDRFPNNNFSLELTEKLIFWQSLDEFSNNLEEDNKFRLFLLELDENKISLIMKFCKTKNDFNYFIKDENIRKILSRSKFLNLELITNLTSHRDVFLNTIDKFGNIVLYRNINILNYLITLYNVTDLEAFFEILWNNNLHNLLLNSTRDDAEDNFFYLLKIFDINDIKSFEKLLENKNLIYIFFDSPRTKYIKEISTSSSDLEKNVSKEYYINFLKHWYDKYFRLFDFILDTFDEDKKDKFIHFLDKKVLDSKSNIKKCFYNDLKLSNKLKTFLYYFLENKQKSLLWFLEKVSFSSEYRLNLHLENFKTFDDFIDENRNINEVDLWIEFNSILLSNKQNHEKIIKQFQNLLKWKNVKWLEKLYMENLLIHFDNLYYKVFKERLISDFKSELWWQNIDFDSIDNSKLDREDFIEAYKMSLNPSYNKREINRLLLDYLTWKFDNLEELNQYKTTGNINWLDRNLSKVQQEVWLSKNRKEIIPSDEIKNIESESSNKNTELRINHHIETAIKKIEELNKLWFEFETNFENKLELKKYFYLEIKKQKENIKEKIWELNIYEDLKFQIKEIFKLEKNNSDFKAKKSSKIIIERELDPIKSLMMWNWVDWSCLSFYSSVWNYYSAISNTIDVNKWVYYIRNEDWTLLGRCLITIWEDKKLSRYKMYYSWRVDIPIDKYFDEYTRKLAKEIWFELNWDQDLVKNIECDKWYQDWTQKI